MTAPTPPPRTSSPRSNSMSATTSRSPPRSPTPSPTPMSSSPSASTFAPSSPGGHSSSSVDIGFTDPIARAPDMITTSDLLAFAEIEPVEVPALPLAQHVAEKVHAYSRQYGETQRTSTRPKDLVDILLIAGAKAIEATALRDAMERTFETGRGSRFPKRFPNPRTTGAAPSLVSPQRLGSRRTCTPRFSRQQSSLTQSSPMPPGVAGTPARGRGRNPTAAHNAGLRRDADRSSVPAGIEIFAILNRDDQHPSRNHGLLRVSCGAGRVARVVAATSSIRSGCQSLECDGDALRGTRARPGGEGRRLLWVCSAGRPARPAF